MKKAPRLLREQLVKLDRQHQLRSEALVWRGRMDYMHGPTVHTEPELAMEKAEKYCSKRTLKMMEKANQKVNVQKPVAKDKEQLFIDWKTSRRMRKQQMRDELTRSILGMCERTDTEAAKEA